MGGNPPQAAERRDALSAICGFFSVISIDFLTSTLSKRPEGFPCCTDLIKLKQIFFFLRENLFLLSLKKFKFCVILITFLPRVCVCACVSAGAPARIMRALGNIRDITGLIDDFFVRFYYLLEAFF